MHRYAAIDRAPETMRGEVAGRPVDRDLGDAGELRPGIVEVGEAQAAPGPARAPPGHARDLLDHVPRALRARRLVEELQPEAHRVDLEARRQLVEEDLVREAVLADADCAQRRGAHARVLAQPFR